MKQITEFTDRVEIWLSFTQGTYSQVAPILLEENPSWQLHAYLPLFNANIFV